MSKPARVATIAAFWSINISAEYSSKENPKLKSQMDECLEKGIPFMVIFGEDEIAKSVVKLKNMHEHTEVEVELANLGKLLIEQGCDAIPSDDVKFLIYLVIGLCVFWFLFGVISSKIGGLLSKLAAIFLVPPPLTITISSSGGKFVKVKFSDAKLDIPDADTSKT